MIIIASILALATLSYTLFTLLILWGLLKKKTVATQQSSPAVAVVIAARNEENNLPSLIQDLLDQDYTGPLDIYVADDRSTDTTWSILRRFAKKHKHGHFRSSKR